MNRTLVDAYLNDSDEDNSKTTLRHYLKTMKFIGRRYRMFEIVNHRFFMTKDSLIVPYDAQGRLSIYMLQKDSEQLLRQVRLPHGTLVTDALVADLAGATGDAIDLEREIYHFHVEDMPTIQVARLRHSRLAQTTQ